MLSIRLFLYRFSTVTLHVHLQLHHKIKQIKKKGSIYTIQQHSNHNLSVPFHKTHSKSKYNSSQYSIAKNFISLINETILELRPQYRGSRMEGKYYECRLCFSFYFIACVSPSLGVMSTWITRLCWAN